MTTVKNVIYVLDVSGSMAEHNKLEMLNDAMDQIGEMLMHPPEMTNVELKVSVYTFSGTDEVTDENAAGFNVLEPILENKSPDMVSELWKLNRIKNAEGGTPLCRAIINVAQILDRQDSLLQQFGSNQAAASIILLSDGQPTTELNCVGGSWKYDTAENVRAAVKRACEISRSFKYGLCGVVAFDVEDQGPEEQILREFIHGSKTVGSNKLFFRAGQNIESLTDAIWSATIGTISNR